MTITTSSSVPAEVVDKPVSVKRALGFVYVGYAFRYLSLLVLVPFYGRVLGAAEYGRVLAAMALYQVVWTLTEYGFPTVGARDVAAARDRVALAHEYGRHCTGRGLLVVVGLAVGAVGTWASPVLRERPMFGVLATLLGVVAAFNMGWWFQGMLQFRTSVIMEVAGFAMNLVFVLAVVRGADDGWLVLASLLASALVATTTAHVIVLRDIDRGAIRFRGGVLLMKQSTALFADRGLGMLMASSSTYIISLFASAAEVGWYGAAERLATVGLSLTQPAGQVLVGTVSRQIRDLETQGEAFALMRKGMFAMTGFGIVLLAGAVLLAPPLVPVILGSDFGPAIPILQTLAGMFPFAAFAQVVVGYVLVPLRYDKLVSLISLLSTLLTVALMLLLGRTYAGIGIAAARALAQAATAVLLLEVLRREQLVGRILGESAR